MANVTPSTHRALLLLDPRFTAANLAADGVDGADYTQADAVPGIPVASAGAPALGASGSQSRTVEVYTTRGGNPGASTPLVAGSYLAPTGVAWRYEGDTSYRGWDPPTMTSEFEFLDRTTTANKYLHPHVVSTPAGDSYLVVQLSERYVQCWSRPNGGQWSAVGTVYDAGSAIYTAPDAACPCLVVLPDGSLLCLYWFADPQIPGIYSSRSSDGGVTWSRGQLVDGYLSIPTFEVDRIRAAYSGGQILMLVSYDAVIDSVIQFASIDEGQSFTVVSTLVDRKASYAEVVAAPGGSGFVVATIETGRESMGVPAPATLAYVRRVSSAFDFVMTNDAVLVQDDASTVEWGTQAAGVITAAELALTVDAAGVLWLVGLDWSSTLEGIVRCSSDGGATWLGVGGTWYDCVDATRGPRQLTVSAQGGRLVLPHTLNASTATASLACAYLGGPTTVCRPQLSSVVTIPEFAQSWTVDWIPYALPEATGATWTYASAGAPTITLTNQGVHVVHGGVLDYATWTATPVTTDAQGLLVGADLKAVAGAIEVTVKIATTYTARLRVTPTAITVTDVGGAVVRATATTTAGATGVQVLIAVGDDGSGGRFRAWWRPWGSGADRQWTVLIGLSSVLTVTGASADAVVFGTGAGTATTDAYARMTHYSAGTDTGGAGTRLYESSAQPNPSGLLGQAISPLPYPCAESGVRPSMIEGPTRPGDTWTIPPTYQRGVVNLDPSAQPSPRMSWRSRADNVSQRLVWSFDEATPMECPLSAVHLAGCNFPTADWCGWDGAAWVVLATIDLRMGTSIKWTRAGAIVNCGTGGGSAIADYVEKNALVGCRIKLGAGRIRKIARNSGGRWTGGAVTTTRPILTLEAPDATDSTSGTTAEIWSHSATAVLRAAVTGYSRYSLHIPATVTAEGYYEIGAVLVGTLQVLGLPDYSRQLITETNVQTTESRDGARRKRRLGTPRRSAVVSWTDGIEGSNVHDASPDYVTDYTGGTPIATPAAMATDLHGTLYANDVTPVVYLPVVPVPASGATVTIITARDLYLYATVETDTLQTDVVAGEEHTGAGSGEYVRVGSVRVDEVL